MLRLFEKTLNLAPVPDVISGSNYDQDYFVDDATGASWSLINTQTSDGLPHILSITNNSAVDHSAITLHLVGTGYYDQPLDEVINLPAANGTVRTKKYFKTLSENPSASGPQGGDTFDVGITDEVLGDAYPAGMYYGNLNIAVSLSDTANYAIDHTFTNVQVEDVTDWNWLNNANDNIGDSTTIDFGTVRPKAVRFKTNSYNNGTVVTINVSQSYN